MQQARHRSHILTRTADGCEQTNEPLHVPQQQGDLSSPSSTTLLAVGWKAMHTARTGYSMAWVTSGVYIFCCGPLMKHGQGGVLT